MPRDGVRENLENHELSTRLLVYDSCMRCGSCQYVAVEVSRADQDVMAKDGLFQISVQSAKALFSHP